MGGNRIYCLAGVMVAALALPAATPAPAQSSLPSAETQSIIKSLPTEPGRRDGASGVDLREFKINPDKLPPSAQEQLKLDADGNATTPLLIPDTMILQFEPNASKESIEALLKSRDLKVVDTFPKLGAVKVEGDLSKYFVPSLNDSNANDTLLRGVNKVITDFKADPIVRSATPDIVLRRQSNDDNVANLMKASQVSSLATAQGQETTDWGIDNIEADRLWTLPGAQDGALFGVMDVGFARHEDITFLELPNKIAIEDHGNHVAAIGCGRHGNGKGVRGVIPNCFVRARTGDVFFESASGNPTLGFLVVFSQVLASLDRFLDQYDDIKVINLSMGYNWRSNFAIDPDAAESEQWRTLVEAQGAFLIAALELADKAGKVIFSAAGNDSSSLATPRSAKYASPFNWAALTAREKGIARNGVVVEAHDPGYKRATFSNRGGNLSCPGVDVLSAVAHDPAGVVSEQMYGTMSGTSMASPYCAAALVLLGLVRPGYSGTELVDCLLASTQTTDTGAPVPKLTQALAKCPAR